MGTHPKQPLKPVKRSHVGQVDGSVNIQCH